MKISTLLFAAALALPIAARAELNDAQIAAIALAAHDIDIHRGKLALKHTKNEEVRQFAQQMVDDHQAGKNEAVALAGKLGVKPEDNDVAKGLHKDAKKSERELKKLKGAAFDKHYIDVEVGYHQAVIDAVKGALVPAAKNEELKKLLVDTGPTLEGHLQHAKNVQAQVSKPAGESKGR